MIMIQSADRSVYAAMLAAGARINKLYCQRHGIEYRAFLGIKRGFHPWHAAFNRILLLQELLQEGFTGWVFYLDADAFVSDLNFDVHAYVARSTAAMIAGPGGFKNEKWDINDGVFLINLGLAEGREIVRLWLENFMQTSEEELRNAPNWSDLKCDQQRLHEVFQANPALLQKLTVTPRHLMNYGSGIVVRQVLRHTNMTVAERTRRIQQETAALLAAQDA